MRVLLILSSILGLATSLAAADPITILDTLNGIDPMTNFNIAGTRGMYFRSNVSLGPFIVLTQTTRLTEIGAYLNTYRSDQSTAPLPIIVRVYASLQNGLPDPDKMLASYQFPADDDMGVMSFQSIRLDLVLPASTYYVLFMAQGADEGDLLGQVGNFGDPPLYASGWCQLGCLGCGNTNQPFSAQVALRIVGEVGDVPTRHVSWGRLKAGVLVPAR